MITVIFIFIINNTSCGKYELSGIEEFNANNSFYGVSARLLPDEKFLELFEYVDGDYHYSNDMGRRSQESELLYLIYDEKNYNLAKSYALECVECSTTNIFTFNGYTFFENVTGLTDNPNSPFEFPYIFNLIGYNDDNRTLCFLGFSIFNPTKKDEQLLTFEDMGAFLKEYFSFYDFEQ